MTPPSHSAQHRRSRSKLLGAMLAYLVLLAPTVGHGQEPADRGAYLTYTTGCVGCHSPHDADGNVLPGRLLAGGDHTIRASNGDAIYPPNITPDPNFGIGAWTESQLEAVLAQGEVPGGRILSSAMPWRTQYNRLTVADMQAIARYLLSVSPVAAQIPHR